MRQIYDSAGKKYEDVVKAIVQDIDVERIEFPLIAAPFNVEKFATLLPEDLADRLNIEPEQEKEEKEEARPLAGANQNAPEPLKPKVLDEDDEEFKMSDVRESTGTAAASSTGETSEVAELESQVDAINLSESHQDESCINESPETR